MAAPSSPPPVAVSVVVPLFNEQENLGELHRRLTVSLGGQELEYELVFVNDGSRDATSSMLEEIQNKDPRVCVVSLSRNFGHQAAISAGIDHATGEAVILMDGDLQDPPEVLAQFIATWRQGNDVVYAIRTKRKEGLFKRACYATFYRVMRATSSLDIPLDSGDFCLMDRKVVEALKALPERNRFVRGLRTFVGFKQTGLAYERAARQAGQPKYTMRALCKLAADGLIGFTDAPLRIVTYVGGVCVAGAGLGGLITLMQAVFAGAVPGWWIATLVTIACTGVQLLGMGILGEYVRRIFWETKGRPTYIVANVGRRVEANSVVAGHTKAA